jgi:DNA polymerase (family 10)
MERLDLKDSHVYRARELGVALVISTDAHTVEALGNLRYGVAVARRGWCEPRHILNTWPARDFLEFIKLEKSKRMKAFSSHV